MQRFMSNLENAIATYVTLPHLGTGHGECSTFSEGIGFVSLNNYWLVPNGIIVVKFSSDVPANSALKVNDKVPKSIYYRGAAIRANVIRANDTATFIYSGGNYNLLCVDRAATNEENVVSFSNLTFSSVIDPSYITHNTTSAQLINENLMLFSGEIVTSSTMPSVTIPSYNLNNDKCFCRIANFKIRHSWWDGKLEEGGNIKNLVINTGTIDNQQYLGIQLRNALTISGQVNIRFSFVAYVDRV